jgi:hypothetical protein
MNLEVRNRLAKLHTPQQTIADHIYGRLRVRTINSHVWSVG